MSELAKALVLALKVNRPKTTIDDAKWISIVAAISDVLRQDDSGFKPDEFWKLAVEER